MYTRGVAVDGFDWDDANVDHIARHGFSPEEVEQVFDAPHKVRRSRANRYTALGQTLDGRFASSRTSAGPGGRIRVVTARDTESKERRMYRPK